jgi:hypothetical protein
MQAARLRDVQAVHYVLYDNYDGEVCAFVTTKAGAQLYLKIRLKECRAAYKDYIQRLQTLQLEEADLSSDFLSLQQVRAAVENWLVQKQQAGSGRKKHKHEPNFNAQDCMEISLQLARLMEQFALQAGAVRSRGKLPPMNFVGDSDLADLLVPRSWLLPVYAATLNNAPWFREATGSWLPTEQEFPGLVDSQESAAEKKMSSKARQQYEKLYDRLTAKHVRAQKRRKTDTMNAVPASASAESMAADSVTAREPAETPLPAPQDPEAPPPAALEG